jgi:hypothetical protein
VNPFAKTKRAADTLGLIDEKRLQIRIRRTFDEDTNRFDPPHREWRLVGGSVGWRDALIENAERFLDAGLIDYLRPAGTGVDEWSVQTSDWSPVWLTRGGKTLLRLWIHEPFAVVPMSEMPERLARAAVALSTAYVEHSGLLEDPPERYAGELRPHAEAAATELLDAQKLDDGRWYP